MRLGSRKLLKKIVKYIILLLVLYLILPLEMGLRCNISKNNISHVEIKKYYYSREINSGERDVKVITDPKYIKIILSYIEDINGIISIKTITNPYGFSSGSSKSVYYFTVFYNEGGMLDISINDKYIGINRRRIRTKFRILNHLKYLDQYFDDIK